MGYNREYYLQNKDKYKQSQKKWKEKNKGLLNDNAVNYAVKHRERILLAKAKYRAKKKNIPFDLVEDDIMIPSHCPIMGIELTVYRGRGRVPTNASIDRIDSNNGYTKDNIQIISDLANLMKNNASKEQLICFAKGILKYYNES